MSDTFGANRVSKIVVGIDAGGTRTRCLLVDEVGTRCGAATGPGANANSSADVEAALRSVLADAIGQHHAGGRVLVDVLVLGVAGAGPAGQPRADALMRAAAAGAGVDIERLVVCSDVETTFAAGSVEPDGTLLVAGTGAVAARLSGFRLATRVDGHGYLLGDAGSAFWIGSAGVRAVLAAIERRGPATALRGPVIEHARAALVDRAELDDVQAVVGAVYGPPPAWLGTFAPLVEAAATAGDDVARRITDDAIAALVTSARLARQDGEPAAPLVIGGAVATGDGLLGCGVRAALERAFVVRPRVVRDASVGAAALALRWQPGVDPAVADRLVHSS